MPRRGAVTKSKKRKQQPSAQDTGSNGLDVLGVLLKWDSSGSGSTHQANLNLALKEVCALLCVSSDTASMIQAAYRGKFCLLMSNPPGEVGARWLAANASLFSSLSFPLGPGDEAAVAAALREAAAAAGGGSLPLEALSCRSPLTAGELLTSAAASSTALTLLTLALASESSKKTATKLVSTALASLTGLQTLRLTTAGPRFATFAAHTSQLGNALGSLSSLTALVLSGAVLLDTKQAKQLPVGSLQRLVVSRRIGAKGGLGPIEELDDHERAPHPSDSIIELKPLDLSHLTSLTNLNLFQLSPRDKLPTSLTRLHLEAPCTFTPALKLPQLQTLSICDRVFNGRADWFDLEDLSSLSTLQSVSIDIDDPFGAQYLAGEFAPRTCGQLEEYAPVLMGIKQLKSLRLTDAFLLPGVINSLSSATGLTRLVLRHCHVASGDDDLTWGILSWPKRQLVRHLAGFAASLRRMTSLQHQDLGLELDDSSYDDGAHPDAISGWHYFNPNEQQQETSGETSDEEEEDEEEEDKEGPASTQDVLTSADLQPIVDAVVSLSNSIKSLRVRLVPSELANCKAPLLSEEQEAALAAVAPAPPADSWEPLWSDFAT